MYGNVRVRKRGLTASYTRPPNRLSPYETGLQTSLPLLEDWGHIDPHKQNTLNDVLDRLRSAHTEEEDPMDCPISGDCVTNCHANGSLKNHVEHNHRVNAHKCSHCGLVLRSVGSLLHHIKVTHDEADHRHPSPEQDCDKSYNTQNLKYHLDSAHKGVKHK